MIYERLVVHVGVPEASVIAPIRITKIFVSGDVLAFLLQACSGGLMAQVDTSGLGQRVMLTGLFVQLLIFSFFLIISLNFYKRTRGSITGCCTTLYGKIAWPKLFYLLLCAAVIITMRCVFRILEFAQGHNGYIASHEVYMYLCDAIPMLGVQVMFHFVHASNVFSLENLSKLGNRDSLIDLYIRTQCRWKAKYSGGIVRISQVEKRLVIVTVL